jgi:hypothetical protein
MKQVVVFLLAIVCFFLAMHVQAVAQTHDRSIEDSWERSATTPLETPRSASTTPRSASTTPPPSLWDVHPAPGTGYPSWDASGPAPAATWPGPSAAAPTGRNLAGTNSALIDSLSNLYCVSSTFITSLRNRNELARGAVAPAAAGKDFQYKTAPAVEIPTGTESADALHRELLLLLERCLYGRQ